MTGMDEAQPPDSRPRTVLAVVEDLLFRSKISTTAKGTGARLLVATSPAAALERARAERPDLILLDLDAVRTGPLDVLRQLQADPALATVPTVGFVSHVHADLIQEARAAGIGRVLARSAFVAELEGLLR
jgi:chemosensory pili system protein ChpA (sensor histidine kinase/response regulator)